MEPQTTEEKPGTHPYQVYMLALCLFALVLLAAQLFAPIEPTTRTILDYADVALCSLFFVDFVVSLVRAPNRMRYFVTWGWIDLASSIPAIDILRIGRAGRILRIFRVLRGVRATKLIASFILERRSEGIFLAVTLVSLLLVVFSSVAILHFENAPDANIKTPEDALWWAFVTITTVGYGDKFPLTSEGRIIACFLMTAGVGLFGTFSGFVAAWFLRPENQQQESELEKVRAELAALRSILEKHGWD
jgi:voltage-gated potassium channel